MDVIKSYGLDALEKSKELFASLRDNFNIDVDLSFLSNKWAVFFIFLLAIVIISFIIDRLLANTFLGKSYRYFVAPGVILHELSHAFFCVITGAKIVKISFFEKDGGKVEHEKSKIPLLGQALISFAPLFFGIVAVFFLARFLGLKSELIDLQDINYSDFLANAKILLKSLNFHSYLNWLLLYLVLSVAVTMTPSTEDFKNAMIFIVIFSGGMFALWRFLSFSPPDSLVPAKLLVLLSTVIFLLILALVLSIMFFAISKFLVNKR